MVELAGKVAVVTGGGSGIGAGMVQAFCEGGMHVVVADIEVAAAEAIVAELSGESKVVAMQVDVTDAASVGALADRVFEEFGAVHVLCNNAGVILTGPFFGKMRSEDWHWIFAVNVFGVVHGLYAFVPRMLKQGTDAHIVNTASMASFAAAGGCYGATKHACNVITESLRAEMAGTSIGVSGLYPGAVPSNIITSQRNRQSRFGEPMEFNWETDILAGADETAVELTSELMDPIEVGRLVRDAVAQRQPWIFTHPHWVQHLEAMDGNRKDEIAAAAAWCSEWKRNHRS
jgi:NAD(P)-dependent dehydrogenase (short-subunit alcohol dehydrogenase family)